ncbi:hypothetical protein [Bosea sp. (in: a-proteobacteria)]|jgi:hypothetical protein|uniref:hypothetical protein n=1 Tax=Bosea sp. (in: a-proteobacteria) TaxID=1871050 RepID=UPI003F6FBCC2
MSENAAQPATTGLVAELGQDEALVLFEMLHRWLDDDRGRTIRSAVVDDAEIWALNALSNTLERGLPQPFVAEYGALLDAARVRLRDKNGGDWPA